MKLLKKLVNINTFVFVYINMTTIANIFSGSDGLKKPNSMAYTDGKRETTIPSYSLSQDRNYGMTYQNRTLLKETDITSENNYTSSLNF